MVTGNTGIANARLSAGGWRRITIQCLRNGQAVAEATVEPVAAGEVFLIAGNEHEKPKVRNDFHPLDEISRIVLFDLESGTWNDYSDVSLLPVWLETLRTLSGLVRTPIGVIDASSNGDTAYSTLRRAGAAVDRCRCVLWQGNVDALASQIGCEEYVQTMVNLRLSCVHDWGHCPPWIVAVSPNATPLIRTAINRTCSLPGFAPGPDLDQIGEMFHLPDGGFNAEGARLAGSLWFASIWQLLCGR